MITITIGGSTFCVQGGGHGDEGFWEVTPSPEAREKGFGVAFFAKTVDTQF